MLALASCGGDSVSREQSPPPHGIVLVSIDTLRADHLPWHGYPRNTAPFLAALAERSTVFLDAVSTSSHTAPSHGSMLTGLYPSQHGATRNGSELPDVVTTLPEILGAEGYDTAAFTSVTFLEGLAKGFDTFVDAGVTEYELRHGLADQSHRRAADTVAAASAWLTERPEQDPFFIWVHLFDVHEWKDQAPPTEVQSRLDATGLSGSALLDHLVENRALQPSWFETEKQLGEAPGNVDRYDGNIAVVDAAIAELYADVSALPGGDDVVWVIVADHGEGFTNHDLLGHSRHIYNEQLKVPLLVHASHQRWPATTVTGVVQPIDIVPTLIELTGARTAPTTIAVGSPSLAPRSWMPLLRTDSTAHAVVDADLLGERFAFSERRPMDEHQRSNGWTGGETRALQDMRYKLIIHDESPAEFYDLLADPLELHDLADEPPREFMHYLDLLGTHDMLLRGQGAALDAGVVNPAHLDELRRLGYLK
jgi:arylsulfatase A-like enzyme